MIAGLSNGIYSVYVWTAALSLITFLNNAFVAETLYLKRETAHKVIQPILTYGDMTENSQKRNLFPSYNRTFNQPFKSPGIPREYILDVLATQPELYPQHLYYYNDDFVTVYDGFPKASIHLLIIPRNRTIRHTGFFLGNVKLMDKLIALETEIVNHLSQEFPQKTFQAGVHAIPSIPLFHLHILSRDLESDALTTVPQWNSMATTFFVPLSTLSTIVRTRKPDAKAVSPYDWQNYVYGVPFHKYVELLTGPMTCNRCNKSFGHNIDLIKDHVSRECTAPMPPTTF